MTLYVTAAPVSTDRWLTARRAFFAPMTRALNPIIRRIAGRAGMPTVGLVRHQGRRSGRVYATPVALGKTTTGFLIPLTFGTTSDWCRNVLAAGHCEVQWAGELHTLNRVELVDDVSAQDDVKVAFNRVQRLSFRAMGLHQFLRLRTDER